MLPVCSAFYRVLGPAPHCVLHSTVFCVLLRSASPASAFYYGKLAKLAGYELDVDMPLYPAHLIDVNPLADYTRGEVDVLAELDIYQTFDGEFAPFTPKPQGEYNLDITLNSKPMEKLP